MSLDDPDSLNPALRLRRAARLIVLDAEGRALGTLGGAASWVTGLNASGTVIGLDIQLRTLGAGMARQKLTPNSQLVLVNAQGEVFAHENSFIVPRGGSHDRPALTHLARFGVPVLTELSKHLQLSQVPATGSLQQVVFFTASRGLAERVRLLGPRPRVVGVGAPSAFVPWLAHLKHTIGIAASPRS